MSCICLPKSSCDDIAKSVDKFWWSSSKKFRKIHWMSWDKLYLPKEKSGLSFRSLIGFNQALLVKQSWRMLCSRDSLVACFFKGKYFPNSDILKSKFGYRPSYVWRSVLWGREPLKKGLRRRIGSGNDTLNFSDPWIPRESGGFKSSTHKPPTSDDLKVPMLIDESGKWDVNILRSYLWEEDVKFITKITICSSLKPDSWIWNTISRMRFFLQGVLISLRYNARFC